MSVHPLFICFPLRILYFEKKESEKVGVETLFEIGGGGEMARMSKRYKTQLCITSGKADDK